MTLSEPNQEVRRRIGLSTAIFNRARAGARGARVSEILGLIIIVGVGVSGPA
jgi:hypothetical protein